MQIIDTPPPEGHNRRSTSFTDEARKLLADLPLNEWRELIDYPGTLSQVRGRLSNLANRVLPLAHRLVTLSKGDRLWIKKEIR